MVARKGRKKKRINFEMSLSGLLGLAVVCLCVLLWMFFLGVWAGQTILLPTMGDEGVTLRSAAKTQAGKTEGHVAEIPIVAAEGKKMSATAPAKSADGGPSFFSLQIESFTDSGEASQAVSSWQARGHKAFLLAPGGEHEPFWRVFVGRFASLAEANARAAALEKEENVKVYITLLPAAAAPLP
jgi:hypothetical protein